MYYINYRYGKEVETVDEFETKEDAQTYVREYNMVQSGHYIITRCTKIWRERK